MAGASAEEIDLLRRSKKKTKRGLSERDDDSMVTEGDETTTLMNTRSAPAAEQTDQSSRTVKGPAISFRRALTGMKQYGRNTGERGESSKGQSGGNQRGNSNNFNKEGFKIWNNSRYGALEDLEEESTEPDQAELTPGDRPDGETGAILSGKGKRPQVQITEAQLSNDKSENNRENNMGRYENGARVEKTTINEEGSTTEIQMIQGDASDHHQDPPDGGTREVDGDKGNAMMEVEYTEGQSSEGRDGAAI
nr:uncharacterized protein LOC109158743 [Ipomoea batatas]